MADLSLAKPFFNNLLQECKRILSPTGSLYFFTDWRGYPFYSDVVGSEFKIDNLLVWYKHNGRPGIHYGNKHELIIYSGHTDIHCGNVIDGIPCFAGGAKKEDGEKVHPTQKPTRLIRKLIEDSTQAGDLVVDLFSGSGTTALAAIQTGRKYIAFELQEKYYDISAKRINALIEQMSYSE